MYFNELIGGGQLYKRYHLKYNRNIIQQNEATGPKKSDEKLENSVSNYIRLFLKTSNMHGFLHLIAAKRHWMEYIIWYVFIIIAVGGAVFISSQSWYRYWNDPTVIAIERDWKNWNTSLPSITMCPKSQFDEEKVEIFLESYPEGERENMFDFIEKLAILDYHHMDELPEGNYFDPNDYMAILTEVKYNLAFQGSDSSDGAYTNALTETGLCTVYNSEIAVYNSPEFFFSPQALKPNKTTHLVEGTALSGDLTTMILDINSPLIVRFSGANDIPDVSSKAWVSPTFSYWMFEFLAMMTTSSDDVRTLQISQRKCRYPDESNLEISFVYSYSLCRMNCRHLLSKRLCGCSPHWYKKVRGVKTCDPLGLKCIKQNRDHIMKLINPKTEEKEPCVCLPTCDDKQYYVDVSEKVFWFLAQNLKYGIHKFPRLRVRREIIFNFSDLMVSIGGTTGLFLGCSLLSFVEIVYFFTLRLFWHIKNNKKTVSNQAANLNSIFPQSEFIG